LCTQCYLSPTFKNAIAIISESRGNQIGQSRLVDPAEAIYGAPAQ